MASVPFQKKKQQRERGCVFEERCWGFCVRDDQSSDDRSDSASGQVLELPQQAANAGAALGADQSCCRAECDLGLSADLHRRQPDLQRLIPEREIREEEPNRAVSSQTPATVGASRRGWRSARCSFISLHAGVMKDSTTLVIRGQQPPR